MPLTVSPRNQRTRQNGSNSDEEERGPPAKRRKMFLQTMGQQLRDLETMKDATSDLHELPNTRSLYFLQSVYGGLTTNGALSQQSIQTPESDIVPGDEQHETSGRESSRPLWRSEELASEIVDVSYTFDHLIEWSQSYFDYWHPAYPFIHAPSMLNVFTQLAHGEILLSDSDIRHQSVILRSIMSIALGDRRQSKSSLNPVPKSLLFESFRDAIDCIQYFLVEETTLHSLQGVMSVLLFLLSMLRYNAASRIEGLAVRMAFQLGLHHCPYKLSVYSEHEAQLRQRMFWSLYSIDRNICPRLGLPLSIQDEDMDLCFPGAEHHKSEAVIETNHQLSLLVFLACQAEFRGSIMKLRSREATAVQSENERLMKINAELTKWWNDVEEYLELNDGESHQISPFHQTVLLILKSEAMIALHRHTVANSSKSSIYFAALQSCVGASKSIIKTLVEKSTGGQLVLIWPSFTWAVWISAFVLIYAANEDQISKELAIKYADMSIELLANLSKRRTIWPEASKVAIIGLRDRLLRGREKSFAQKQNGDLGSARKARGFGTVVETLNGQTLGRTRRQHVSSGQDYGHLADAIQVRDFSETPTRSTASVRNQQDRLQTPVPNPVLNRATDTRMSSSTSQDIAHAQRHPTGVDQYALNSVAFEGTSMDLFYGSEIPFWIGDDQLLNMSGTNFNPF